MSYLMDIISVKCLSVYIVKKCVRPLSTCRGVRTDYDRTSQGYAHITLQVVLRISSRSRCDGLLRMKPRYERQLLDHISIV